MGRVDDDLEVVVQLLTDVPAQLRRHDSLGIGVEAGDAEIDFVLGVKNTDFRHFRRGLPLITLALDEVVNRNGLEPEWIIQYAVQLRGTINASCLCDSERLLKGTLRSLSLRSGLRLGV